MSNATSSNLDSLTRTDRVGMGISVICMVHCAAFPMLLVLLPFWPSLEVVHEWVHIAFAAIILPVGVVAIQKGLELHATRWIPFCIGAGVFMIFFALWAGHTWFGLGGEVLFTFIGSALLLLGHFQNSRMGRKCAPCEDSCKVC